MKDQDIRVEFEQPPGKGRPPYLWGEDVPFAQWNDWRWQLPHRLNTVEDFAQVIHLTPEEVGGLSAPGFLHVDATF
jgi:lysine 2,3-aminomutase